MNKSLPQFDELTTYTAEIEEQLGYLSNDVIAIKNADYICNESKKVMDRVLVEISVVNTLHRNIVDMINEAMNIELNNTKEDLLPCEIRKYKIISKLSYIYEQIAEYMGATYTKIIDYENPVKGYNIGTGEDNFFLYQQFSLDDLITATHYIFKYIYDIETVDNKLCATFAHNGMIFGALVNINTGKKYIIRVCSELPDNIRSLDSILKEYTDMYSKDQEEMAICNRLLLTKENKEKRK